MLSEQQKQYCIEIYNGIKKREPVIRNSAKLSTEQIVDCVEAVRDNYPELFYIDFSSVPYSYIKDDEWYGYRPLYIYSENEIQRKKKEIDNAIANIFSKINIVNARSAYHKCVLLHNYLVKTCIYDYEAYEANHSNDKNTKAEAYIKAYTIEGVFLKNCAVCMGISLAFKLLCERLNIQAIVATGYSLKPGCTTYGGHAWNIVRGGECAAHVDVTWDMCLSKGSPIIRYDYFFLPDLEAMRDHQYVGYPICRQLKSTYYERTDTQFDSIDKLEKYIRKGVEKAKQENFSKPLYFQFKMKNKRETKDMLIDFAESIIRSITNKGYTWNQYTNDIQSVFVLSIVFNL